MKKAVLILLTFITIFMVGCAPVADEEKMQEDSAQGPIADNEESRVTVEKERAESSEAVLTEASHESEEVQKGEITKENEEELDKNPNAGEAYGGKLDISEEELKETIIAQIADMNQYITDHCGWPEDEYPYGAFCGTQDYIDELIIMAQTGEFIGGPVDSPSMEFGDTPNQELAKLKWSMFNRSQFFLGMHNDYPEYYDILTHWLNQGHFSIETIDTISVEYVTDIVKFDTHHCNIIVTFTSNGETYICWMEGITASAEGSGYKILDVQRQ